MVNPASVHHEPVTVTPMPVPAEPPSSTALRVPQTVTGYAAVPDREAVNRPERVPSSSTTTSPAFASASASFSWYAVPTRTTRQRASPGITCCGQAGGRARPSHSTLANPRPACTTVLLHATTVDGSVPTFTKNP